MTQFTSKAIEESFIRLLNERPLDKITIKDIVDDCGISRNTFYYHFQDITALLEHILNADVERGTVTASDMDSWEDGFISAARSLWRISVWSTIFTIPSAENGWSATFTVSPERSCGCMYPGSRNRWNMRLIKVFPEDQKMVVDFAKFALVGMILDWLNTGMKKDPEGLIRRVGEIFHGNIEAALTRVAPLIWTFFHVCTYLGLFKSNAQFLCIAFFVRFQDWIPCIQYQLRKESTTKGALFYEIW